MSRLCVTLAMPVLIVLISLRLVMTPAFLHIEYSRPGFPADYYGFTREDRLTHARHVTNYLLSADEAVEIGRLEFTNGSKLFTEQELDHLRELKQLIKGAYLLALLSALTALCSAVVLWRNRRSRGELFKALLRGSLLTVALTLCVLSLAAISWGTFFTGLHKLFFRGTWKFHYSHTLIRLFPRQFWLDATIIFVVLTLFSSALMSSILWQWYRKSDIGVPRQSLDPLQK